jgi:hypothetical protein
MPKSQDKTTAENLEEKFDRGENVLDYFDVRRAQVIHPKAKQSNTAAKVSYPAKQNAARRTVVRDKSGGYRKKTG